MRRVLSSVTVALSLLGATVAWAGVALAGSAPAASAVTLAAAQKRCTVTDDRLREVSGLVATKSGYIVVNDGTDDESRKRVFFLDTKCKIAKDPVRYTGSGPFDTEDLALSPNGRTLWIADTGDNVTSKTRRERVAVWSMPVSGSKQPVLHRLSYPEGKPRDAEALLINGDGKPLVITKVTTGKAEIFTPAGALRNGDTEPVPMKKVGEVTLPKTDTENRLGALGRTAVTGAARSPDGSRVVLRTYADAFEYDVTDGDVVAALAKGTPRVTALADPFGEAISYTPDGKTFVTISDGGQLEADEPIDILAYKPSTEGAKAIAGAAAPKAGGEQSWFDGLSLQDITYLIGAVGLIGVLMVGAGVFGIVRARRNPPPADRDDDGPDRDDDPDDGVGFPGSDGPLRAGGYGAAPAAGVYGAPAGVARSGAVPPGGRGGAAPVGGAVYGGGRAGGGGPAGGGVYGGGRPAGGGAGVYGGRSGGGPTGGAVPAGGRGGVPAGGRGGVPAGGRGGVADHGRGGGPRGEAPRGDGPRGGRPRGEAPRDEGRRGGRSSVGGRGGSGVYGGGPVSGGPVSGGPSGGGQPDRGRAYGGGRAEPPRRGQDQEPRGQRSGRRRDDDGYPDERGGPYGQLPGGGRGYRGDRY
ncbi:hypothetical protein [Micromonospora endolithica]|uniref:hypothetical protein n=1 Tax=Micromonospora endolithica TaxID=230091 RepID=UPI0011ACC2C3|nr:hypothetical protein [Micromonospora endolithica]TWJ23352.1 hypothetical protein JD76_03487 [Micromonospora endolithica]